MSEMSETKCETCGQEPGLRRRDGLLLGCPQCGADLPPVVVRGKKVRDYNGWPVYFLMARDGLSMTDDEWERMTGAHASERHSRATKGQVWRTGKASWAAVIWLSGRGEHHDGLMEGPFANGRTQAEAIERAVAAWSELRNRVEA